MDVCDKAIDDQVVQCSACSAPGDGGAAWCYDGAYEFRCELGVVSSSADADGGDADVNDDGAEYADSIVDLLYSDLEEATLLELYEDDAAKEKFALQIRDQFIDSGIKAEDIISIDVVAVTLPDDDDAADGGESESKREGDGDGDGDGDERARKSRERKASASAGGRGSVSVRIRMVDGGSGRDAAQQVRNGNVGGSPTLLSNNRSPGRARPGTEKDAIGSGLGLKGLILGIVAPACFISLAAVLMVHNKRRRLGHHSHGAQWPGDDPSGGNGGGGGPVHQTSIPIDHSKLDAFGFHPVHYAVVKGDLSGLAAIVQRALGAVPGILAPQRSGSLLSNLSTEGKLPIWAEHDLSILQPLGDSGGGGGASSTGSTPMYDSANGTSAGSTPVYDSAGGGGTTPMYDSAGASPMYDSAGGGGASPAYSYDGGGGGGASPAHNQMQLAGENLYDAAMLPPLAAGSGDGNEPVYATVDEGGALSNPTYEGDRKRDSIGDLVEDSSLSELIFGNIAKAEAGGQSPEHVVPSSGMVKLPSFSNLAEPAAIGEVGMVPGRHGSTSPISDNEGGGPQRAQSYHSIASHGSIASIDGVPDGLLTALSHPDFQMGSSGVGAGGGTAASAAAAAAAQAVAASGGNSAASAYHAGNAGLFASDDAMSGSAPSMFGNAAGGGPRKATDWNIEQGDVAPGDRRPRLSTRLGHGGVGGVGGATTSTAPSGGAVLDIRDRHGNTPTAWAVRTAQMDMLQYLLQNSADAQLANLEHTAPIHFACMLHSEPTICAALLATGINVNAFDGDGNTPLMHACRVGNGHVIDTLLKGGADVTLKNNQGMTVLTQAITAGNCQIAEGLLQHPLVASNVQDRTGRCALHWAVTLSQTNTVKFLMVNNEDCVFLESDTGENPFQLAISKDLLEIVQTIAAHLPELKLKRLLSTNDAHDRTPSEIATQSAAARVLPYLLNLPQYQQVAALAAATAASAAQFGTGGGASPAYGSASSGDEAGGAGRKRRLSTADDQGAGAVAGAGVDHGITWNPTHPRTGSNGSTSSEASSFGGQAAGGGGSAALQLTAQGKPKQTVEEARTRRRNYMRSKRAGESKQIDNLKAQVAVLTNEDSRLEVTLQRMRNEAAELRARVGIPSAGAGAGAMMDGGGLAETGFGTAADPALFAGHRRNSLV